MEIEGQNGLNFKINEEDLTASVTKSPKATGDVFIPRFVDYQDKKYKIISLGERSFENNIIESITFQPDSEIESFEETAFFLSAIKKVQIPSSLKTIKPSCFCNSKSLTEFEISPDNQTFSYLDNKFLACKSDPDQSEFDVIQFCRQDLKGEVLIPSQIKTIKLDSFYECNEIKAIKFEENSKIETIEYHSFPRSIEYFEIPKNLKNLKMDAFYMPKNLVEMKISPGNEYFSNYNDKFVLRRSEIENDIYDELFFCRRDLKDIEIPKFIKKICDGAFDNHLMINSLKFEENSLLEVIEDHAFYFSSLSGEIFIPEKVRSVGMLAFGITQIKSIQFLGEKISFGAIPFHSCSDLRLISFPNAKSIYLNGNFDKKIKFEVRTDAELEGDILKYKDQIIYISKNSQSIMRDKSKFTESDLIIKNEAYKYTRIEEIIIPSQIEIIGSNCFPSTLKEVEFEDGTPYLKKIGDNAFKNTQIETIKMPLETFPFHKAKNVFLECKKLNQIIFDHYIDINDPIELKEEEVIIENSSSDNKLELIKNSSSDKAKEKIEQNLNNSNDYYSEEIEDHYKNDHQINNSEYNYEKEIIKNSSNDKEKIEQNLNNSNDYYSGDIEDHDKNDHQINNSEYNYEKEIIKNSSSDKELELIKNNSSDKELELIKNNSSDKELELIKNNSSDKELELIENNSSDKEIELIKNNSSDKRKIGLNLTDYEYEEEQDEYKHQSNDSDNSFSFHHDTKKDDAYKKYRLDNYNYELDNNISYFKRRNFEYYNVFDKYKSEYELVKVEKSNDKAKSYLLSQTNIEKLEVFVTDLNFYYFFNTPNLTEITIPKSDKGKYNMQDGCLYSKDNKLIVAERNIKSAIIKSQCKLISNFAFNIKSLEKVSFEKNSELKEISVLAFTNSQIQIIVIPDSVKLINYGAFYNCKRLQNVHIPNSIKTIDYFTFAKTNLKNIEIPAKIEYLKFGCFYKCSKLNKISFNTSIIKEIDDFAFAYTNIEEILIPDSVETIGNFCFLNCSQLKTINFNSSSLLKKIGRECFIGTAIKSIKLPELIEDFDFSFTEIVSITFSAKSNLNRIYNFYSSKIVDIKIPPSIEFISKKAFSNCQNLERVIIINSQASKLEAICNEAFYNCIRLKEFEIPKTVKYFGQNAFKNCCEYNIDLNLDSFNVFISDSAFENSKINSITIKCYQIAVDKNAFKCCKYLKNVDLNVQDSCYIGSSAFEHTSSLNEFQLEKNVSNVSFGQNCFKKSNIETMEVPESLLVIPDSCFESCSKLKSIIFPEYSRIHLFGIRAFANSHIKSFNFPKSTRLIKESCFERCSFLSEISFSTEIVRCCIEKKAFKKSGIEKLTIPCGIKEIKESCFKQCKKLKIVDFTDTVEMCEIKDNVFESSGIVQVTLSPLICSIGKSSFQNCKKLKKVSILCDDVFILPSAFSKCSSLKKFKYTSILNIGLIDSDFFISIKGKKVDQSIINNFLIENKSINSFFFFDYNYSFYTSEKINFNNLIIKRIVFNFLSIFQEFQLFYHNNGCYFTNEKKNLEYCDFNTKSLIVPKETEKIKSKAFMYTDLKEICFENSSILKKIESNVFESLQIKEITIPDSVKIIDDYAFNDCKILEKVVINKTSQLKRIGKCAFQNTAIKKILFPSTLVVVDDFAFYQCHKLEIVTNYSNKIKFGCQSFAYSPIKEIKFPQKSFFDYSSFKGCLKLKQLVFLDKPKKIIFDEESFAFSGIEELKLNCDLEIRTNSFMFCLSLKNVFLKGNIKCEDTAFLNSNLESLYLMPNDPLVNFELSLLPLTINKMLIAYKEMFSIEKHECFINHKCFIKDQELIYADLFVNSILFEKQSSENSSEIKKNEVLQVPSKATSLNFQDVSHIKRINWGSNCNINSIGKEYSFSCYNLVEITIPKLVKEIPDYCFQHCHNLSILSFEEDSILEDIGKYAFSYTNLQKVNLPKTVKHISSGAFSNNLYLKEVKFYGIIIESNAFADTGLIKFILSDNTETISNGAFQNCKSLKVFKINPEKSNLSSISSYAFAESGINRIDIPSKVQRIYSHTFSGCRFLKEVNISNDSVKYIDDYSFAENLSLVKINIPKSIQCISPKAFINTPSLLSIMNESSSTYFVLENNIVIGEDRSLYFVPRNLKQVKIPENIPIIHSGAFCGPHIKEVTFTDDSLIEIEKCGFAHSTRLLQIKIPKSVQKIGEDAFIDCQRLQKVDFDESCQLKEIPKFCFAFSGLRTINLPPSIEIINHSSFYFCLNLTDVDLSNTNLKYIGEYAFAEANIEQIKFPSSLQFICNHSFDGNKSLKLVDLTKLNVVECKQLPLDYIIMLKPKVMERRKKELEYEFMKSLELYLQGKIKSINTRVKVHLGDLTLKSLKLTGNIDKISQFYLIHKTNLNKYYMSDASSKFSKYIETKDLDSANDTHHSSEIETKSENINKKNEDSDSSLNELSDTDQEIKSESNNSYLYKHKMKFHFSRSLNDEKLKKPKTKIDELNKYFKASIALLEIFKIKNENEEKQLTQSSKIQEKNSSNICYINNYAFSNCIIDTFKFNLKAYEWFKFYDSCAKIKRISLNHNVHILLQRVKNENQYKESISGSIYRIKKVNTRNPESIVSIPIRLRDSSSKIQKELSAFIYDFSKITKLILDDNIVIKSIPKFIFSYSPLKEISIPPSVQIIENYSFGFCHDLEKVTISKNSELNNIEIGAFYECRKLKSFYFPNKLQTIGKRSFSFTCLESIEIQSSIEKIECMTFFNCTKLKEIIFNEGITEIGESSFENNISLKIVNLPDSLKTIKSYAFSNCVNLEKVNTTSNTKLVEIYNGAFENTQIEKLSINQAANKLFEPRKVPKLNKIEFYNGKPMHFIQFEDGTIYEKTTKFENKQNAGIILFEWNEEISKLIYNGFIKSIYYDYISIDKKKLYLSNCQDSNYEQTVRDFLMQKQKNSIYNLVFAPKNLDCLRIPENCFSVNNSIFDGMTNLSSIEYMKGSLNMIFDFPNYDHHCSKIKAIKILGDYSFMDRNIFSYFDSLEIVEFGESTNIAFISKQAFMDCKNLKQIIIPSSCLSIEEGAFKNCISLKTIQFGTSTKLDSKLQFIKKDAFLGCSSLEYVILPPSLFAICDGAFMNCSNLKNVEFGFNVLNSQNKTVCKPASQEQMWLEVIEKNAFRNCVSLLSFHLPSTCVYLGPCCFMNCTSLKTFEYNGEMLRSINNRTFYNCTSLEKFEINSLLYKTNYFDIKLFYQQMDFLFEKRPSSYQEYNFIEKILTEGKYLYRYDANFKIIRRDAIIRYLKKRNLLPSKYMEYYEEIKKEKEETKEDENKNQEEEKKIEYNLNFYLIKTISRLHDNDDFQFSINTEAFMNCSSLKEIIIEDSSRNLITIEYDNSKNLIKKYPYHVMFYRKYGLKRQSIKKRAFCNCKSLINARFFLGNLESFDENAFLDCSSLKKIEINSQFSRYLLTEKFNPNAFKGTPNDLVVNLYSNGEIMLNSYSQIHNIKCHTDMTKRHYKKYLSSLNHDLIV